MKRSAFQVFTMFIVSLLLLSNAGPVLAQPGGITRVSVDSSGGQSDKGGQAHAVISADGRYVAFESEATNLVSGDNNNVKDVFLHDRQTGITTRISVDSNGIEGNSLSFNPAISADGRYVAFDSWASNLVAADANGGMWDVFLHDTQTGTTTLVSVDSSSVQGNGSSYQTAISGNGRYVAFTSSSDNLDPGDMDSEHDIFVHDTQTGTTALVSVDSYGVKGNDYSMVPSISYDGRYVAFYSAATNLVAGDSNDVTDIFVHDMQTGATTLVSVDSTGVQGNNTSLDPFIASDGRYIAYRSSADNLVSGDTNLTGDIFVYDMQEKTTERVSISTGGDEANSSANRPSISADGRYVVFDSWADNLVDGDTNEFTDVFVHDRQSGITKRISVNSSGEEGNGESLWARISADGTFMSFESDASNLVGGDTNGVRDVFIHECSSEIYNFLPIFRR
jgi:hypothetical protein